MKQSPGPQPSQGPTIGTSWQVSPNLFQFIVPVHHQPSNTAHNPSTRPPCIFMHHATRAGVSLCVLACCGLCEVKTGIPPVTLDLCGETPSSLSLLTLFFLWIFYFLFLKKTSPQKRILDLACKCASVCLCVRVYVCLTLFQLG